MSVPLPTVELQLQEQVLQALERNLWSDRYVGARTRAEDSFVAVKVRYRGGHTRSYPKRSYEVVHDGRVTHYNAEYDDPSMIRNALSFAFFNRIGVPAPKTEHVRLAMNGKPLGVYLAIEGVGRSFFAKRSLGVSALFYAVNNDADFGLTSAETGERKRAMLSGYEHRYGGAPEKIKLSSFIRAIHARSGGRIGTVHHRAASKLDVDNYLRWLAGAVLTGNYDGFEQNYAIYRSSRTGRYRIVPWDYEGTWGRNCYGRAVDSNMVSISGYNHLTRKLLENRSIRAWYARLLRELIDGPFTEQALMPLADSMLGRIAPYVREDGMQRWSYREFAGESARIRRYIRERREGVNAELRRW